MTVTIYSRVRRGCRSKERERERERRESDGCQTDRSIASYILLPLVFHKYPKQIFKEKKRKAQ